MELDSSRMYTERQINAELRRWSREVAPAIECDHVTIRRLLVDYGQLERSADGAEYRVGFPPQPIAFDLEVDMIDCRATVAAYLDQRQRRPRPASD